MSFVDFDFFFIDNKIAENQRRSSVVIFRIYAK